MPILRSRSFIALPKPRNDPVQMRPTKFLTKLEEQKLLLKYLDHAPTERRWTKVNTERQTTTVAPASTIAFSSVPA